MTQLSQNEIQGLPGDFNTSKSPQLQLSLIQE